MERWRRRRASSRASLRASQRDCDASALRAAQRTAAVLGGAAAAGAAERAEAMAAWRGALLPGPASPHLSLRGNSKHGKGEGGRDGAVQPFFYRARERARRRARATRTACCALQSPTMARSALALLLCAALLGGSAAEVAKGDALRASAPAPLKAADPLKGPLGRTCAVDGALEDVQLSAPLNRRAERAARSRWRSSLAASRFKRNAQLSHSLSARRDVPHEPLRDLRVRHAASRVDFACTACASSLTDSRLALRVSSNYCGPGWCSSGAQAACSRPLEPARLPVSLALGRLREREQLQLRSRAAGRLLHRHVLHGARQVLRLLRRGRFDDLRPGFGQGPGAVQHAVHGLPEQLQAA